MRSFFARLRRRFGPRVSGHERVRRAAGHRARIARFLPLNLLTHAIPPRAGRPVRVAVVGGGFAGLAAARALQNLQATVTVFEARAQLGGRVQTNSTFLPGRLVETGAELIGANHPLWLQLAREFGFGLSAITEDDRYGEAGLALPVRLLGHRLTPTQVEKLHGDMEKAANDLVRRAAPITDPYNPWTAPGAGPLDHTSLLSWIMGFADPVLRAALDLEYANDNCMRTASQSLLAVLSQIAGGGGARFWEDVEVFRCGDGNVALANALATAVTGNRPKGTIHLSEVVTDVRFLGDGRELEVTSSRPGALPRQTRHDFVVLALPPSVWSRVTIDGKAIPILPRVQMGPSLKCVAATEKRFWVKHGDAPSGVSDELGQVWETTDNQVGGTSVALTLFAGGPFDDAIPRPPAPGQPDDFVDPRIEALLPGYRGPDGKKGKLLLADWTNEPFIKTGYCIPKPGQVTTAMLLMQQSIAGRVFFAGEHVSPCFFGFMEGALQTGLAAAARIADAIGLTLPAAIGTLSGTGVRPTRPPSVPMPSRAQVP